MEKQVRGGFVGWGEVVLVFGWWVVLVECAFIFCSFTKFRVDDHLGGFVYIFCL